VREQERQGRRFTGRSRAISVIVVCGSLPGHPRHRGGSPVPA